MYCECEYGDGRLPLLFIVNPAAHSGEGYALWKQAEAVLQERSIPYEVYFSEKRGDVRQLAKQLTNVSEGAERFLIVLGGDGTLNEAIQGMQHFEQVRLGYIPTGSSNDLARDLKIGHDIRPLMKKLLDGGTEHRMDLGCVTWNADGKTQKRHFLVSCGIGYDAAVCQEALDSPMKDALNKFGLGKLTYLGIGLKQMLTLQYCRASIRLDGREIIKAGKLLFAAGMIHRYEGGGFCFCPKADDQDGLLDLCVVNNVPRWKFPIIIPFALKGKHGGFKGVDQYRASRIEIRTSTPCWVQTDGEIPGKPDRIELTVEKQKIRFIV